MMEKIFSMKKSTYLEQNLKYMLPKTSIQQIIRRMQTATGFWNMQRVNW